MAKRLPPFGRETSKLCEFPYLFDFLSLFPIPYRAENHNFSELYKKHQLSLKQIAEKTGVSKSTVLKKLKKENVSRRAQEDAQTNPKNYRSPNPPFGFRVIEGRLVQNRAEIHICRKIIHMKNDGLSFSAISTQLTKEGIKNRKKTTYWCHKHLKRIYNYWKDKL